MWTIYITNDNCPDYTWGLTEQQTRKAFADVVKGHLDEMIRTDADPPGDQDRYNMAVTQEALCFVEHYPQRKDELIRRIREGRIYVGPYLCNTLWGFQGVEGAIRAFYPARRLEKEWGLPPQAVAEHIEEPSLPWGTATILAGCGIRWLSSPFYAYDSTFGGLKNPPVFIHEGPDGGQVRVVMDPWACNRASYTQGANLLGKPDASVKEWLARYEKLGSDYPARAILASGTHGDISPGSGGQARSFAEKIRQYNARPDRQAALVNATLPQFCAAIDQAQAKTPFLRTVRGCFGHSWDLWPVSLARYVADMREGERRMLAAEALLAIASAREPALRDSTLAGRRRAEWCWAMLADHAWNGTNDANKRHNADLRRDWAGELNRIAGELQQEGRAALGAKPGADRLTLLNTLSCPRRDVVRVEAPAGSVAEVAGRPLPSQAVQEDGRSAMCFISPPIGGLAAAEVRLHRAAAGPAGTGGLTATPAGLDGPFYRLTVDAKTGGLASLVHKPTGTELLAPKTRRTICQTVFFDGKEHILEGIRSEAVAAGPVFATLKVAGATEGVEVTGYVTIYAELDRVDFDVRVNKPATTQEQRLCHVFPVLREGAVLRVETPGAVIRPYPQPAGDLLPGTDGRRFAVQGFVDASSEGFAVTIAPLDAFVLRMDLDPITFEALGNDQNYREVVQDQHGVTEFRFRYALRARAGGYSGPESFVWSRSAATPLLTWPGAVADPASLPGLEVDPARAIATCLKPADGPGAEGVILRLWETAGRTGPLSIGVRGFRRAVQTDLLERDIRELPVADGKVAVDIRPLGLAAVRLLP